MSSVNAFQSKDFETIADLGRKVHRFAANTLQHSPHLHFTLDQEASVYWKT